MCTRSLFPCFGEVANLCRALWIDFGVKMDEFQQYLYCNFCPNRGVIKSVQARAAEFVQLILPYSWETRFRQTCAV